MTEEQLAAWTGPSSATESEKQERTERMVREAISAHAPFEGVSISVKAKGSYPNNTNVRQESDVDVAVQCSDCVYWNEAEPGVKPAGSPYEGIWTPENLRNEVAAALEAKFPGQVDTGGKMAILVESSSARVNADVVPCFKYVYYFANGNTRQGSKIFRKDGSSVENYSQQQLEAGRAKNTRTATNYKKVVRILKRAAVALIQEEPDRKIPSYFVESLVFNCPDSVFSQGSWTARTKSTLAHIYNELEGAEPSDEGSRWLEANDVKFLFHWAQSWTRADARRFAEDAWEYLGFTS